MDVMDYLSQAKESIIRFEYLQEYKSLEEDISRSMFERTGTLDTLFIHQWWNFLELKHSENVLTQRVRLVREPQTAYTKWELLVHAQAQLHGDDVRVLTEDKLTSTLERLKDFWLVDSSIALSMEYSANGEYLGFTVYENAEEYLAAKECLLENSSPLSV